METEVIFFGSLSSAPSLKPMLVRLCNIVLRLWREEREREIEIEGERMRIKSGRDNAKRSLVLRKKCK